MLYQLRVYHGLSTATQLLTEYSDNLSISETYSKQANPTELRFLLHCTLTFMTESRMKVLQSRDKIRSIK